MGGFASACAYSSRIACHLRAPIWCNHLLMLADGLVARPHVIDLRAGAARLAAIGRSKPWSRPADARAAIGRHMTAADAGSLRSGRRDYEAFFFFFFLFSAA
jgi:hypothetical protein